MCKPMRRKNKSVASDCVLLWMFAESHKPGLNAVACCVPVLHFTMGMLACDMFNLSLCYVYL